MKQLMNKTVISLSLVALSACSTQPDVAPSQNRELNAVSKSNVGKENSYFLQNSLDYFLNEELAPVVKNDKEMQEKYKDRESDNFTLQEAFDKLNVYRREKPNDFNSSNVHKLETMPVIGSTRKR